MAYRNQNYMTNRKIKEEVDKNQKDYTPDDGLTEVEISFEGESEEMIFDEDLIPATPPKRTPKEPIEKE